MLGSFKFNVCSAVKYKEERIKDEDITTMRNNKDRHLAQRAKKVVSDSPGLVDFAIGLVNSLFNLPDRQVMFFEEFE